jgi:kynurenine 3-monooxygenase
MPGMIIGADGVNSTVREQLQTEQNSKHFQEYASVSYKQLFFTKEDITALKLLKHTAYTWSRKNCAILEFPNTDGTGVAMFVLPKKNTRLSFASLQNAAAVENLIRAEFPALKPVLNSISRSVLSNPEGSYVTIHTHPWYYGDFIAVIGDAAHGFLPFFGQGMSAAFGDCREIVRLLKTHEDDWAKVLPLYEQERKQNMDTLGDLSKQAFARYRRDKKADYTAVYEKLEEIAHKYFPKIVLPPLFMSIARDPDHTADHVRKYKKQQKIASYCGFSLLAHAVTALFFIREEAFKLMPKQI